MLFVGVHGIWGGGGVSEMDKWFWESFLSTRQPQWHCHQGCWSVTGWSSGCLFGVFRYSRTFMVLRLVGSQWPSLCVQGLTTCRTGYREGGGPGNRLANTNSLPAIMEPNLVCKQTWVARYLQPYLGQCWNGTLILSKPLWLGWKLSLLVFCVCSCRYVYWHSDNTNSCSCG